MDDHEEAIRSAVARLRPVDRREARSKATFLAELDRLPRPLDEHADPTHVTTSAVVVGPRGVLLHRHKRLGVWMQPGGHIDAGEAPEDAVLREVIEETGVEVTHPFGGPRIVHVDVHAGGRGHTHLDVRYLLEAGDVDPSPPPGESQEVRWYSWDRALAIADAGLVGALRAVSPTPRRRSGRSS